MSIAAQDIALQMFEPRHLADALALSRAEGWPHRIEDWRMSLQLGEGLVALRGERVVGTAMLTPYGKDAATCSMIIVDTAMRGRGLGRWLMAALLDIAGARECRLTATVAGLPLYEKMGFVATGKIHQYQGIVESAAPSDGRGIRRAATTDLPTIRDLDRAAIGMARHDLLARLLEDSPIALSEDGEGYLAVRRFGKGQLIGPVVARSNEPAERLLRHALADQAGRLLRIDLTDAAEGLAAIAGAAGLRLAGGGVAMTKPGARHVRSDGTATVYALASQALC